MSAAAKWIRETVLVVALLALACQPNEETQRFLNERTFAGPSLDLSKPGTAEWVCNYQGRQFAQFHAELVFTIDNTRSGMESIIWGTFLLRASISCFTHDAAGGETPLPALQDLRPFDAPRSLSTDGVDVVLASFMAGGPQTLVIRFAVTNPDPALAELHPRLSLRPEYLAK